MYYRAETHVVFEQDVRVQYARFVVFADFDDCLAEVLDEVVQVVGPSEIIVGAI